MKAEEREEAGIEVPWGVPHLLLPAQTWAENRCEKCGGPTLNKPLHLTQDRRRERKEVLSKCVGGSVRRWVGPRGAVFSIPGPDLRDQGRMCLGVLTRRVGDWVGFREEILFGRHCDLSTCSPIG